jgi:hypothetical protein
MNAKSKPRETAFAASLAKSAGMEPGVTFALGAS